MSWHRQQRRQGVFLVVGILASTLGAATAHAQRARSSDVLSPTYVHALSSFYSGDFTDAARGFRDAGSSAIRVGETRWIDSISYHAMLGESYYQLGQLSQALDHFGSALQLFKANADWMQRVQFPRQTGPRTAAVAPVPWGQSQRRFRLGQVPDKFNITRGQNNLTVVGSQTILQPGEMLMSINAAELVRTTALAIRRRRELLGPAAAHDTLLQEVVGRLAGRPGQNGSLSEAWLDVQLGIGYSATGRKEQAVTALTRSLVVDGEFDHPLTGLALLELGRLAEAKGDFAAALRLYAEASYSGYYFSQPEVVEDALRSAAVLHMQGGGKGVYPPLAAAAEWAHSRRLRTLQAGVLISAAENATSVGDSRQATTLLSQATRVIARKELAQSLLGAHINFTTALLAYQRRQAKAAEPALAAAIAWQRKGSVKLFHMAMVDQFYREGIVRDREALDLFASVLDEPSAGDWRRDPLEALTMLLVPQEALLGHWLDAAVAREDWKTSLEVCDRMRRNRFYATLPLGGRLLSLRWILEGPESALTPEAVLQRNDLLTRHAPYRDLIRQVEKLRGQLAALPPMPDDRDQVAQQVNILLELTRLNTAQEGILMELALAREPAAMVFPPQRTVEEVQKGLQPGQAILVFQSTGRSLYGFLVTPKRIGAWKVIAPDMVRKKLASLLRSMGHFDQNREVDMAVLADPTWRGEAASLLAEIFQTSKIDLGQGIQELVIVPDDLLWYVPFEALQIGPPNKTETLLSRMRVRYAPTIGLAVPDGRPRRQAGATGVVLGRVYPHEPEELAAGALERLKKALPQAVPLHKLPAAPAPLIAQRFDSLLVLDDLGSDEAGYQLSPLRLDRGHPASRLEEWLSFAPSGPDVMAFPGFHTPAENGLKKLPRTGRPGDELFLTSCALMATGTRTALISRWRNGGNTCNDLLVEWLPELRNTSAADAWQRAVEVARQAPLDITLEPRVKSAKEKDAEPMKADHPFFWAGYLLLDTGTDPRIKAPPKPAGAAPPRPVAPAPVPPAGGPAGAPLPARQK